MPLSHLPSFSPEAIRELTARDEEAEIVIKKLKSKFFVILVRKGREDLVGKLCSPNRPDTVATFENIGQSVIAAIELAPERKVFFDMT